MRRVVDLSMLDYPVVDELVERPRLRAYRGQSVGRLSGVGRFSGVGRLSGGSMGAWKPGKLLKKMAKAINTNVRTLSNDIAKASDKISHAAAVNASNLRKDIKVAAEKIKDAPGNLSDNIAKAADKISHAAAVNAKNLRKDVRKAGDKIAAATKTNIANLKKDLKASGVGDVLKNVLVGVADAYTGGLVSQVKGAADAKKQAAAQAAAQAASGVPGAQPASKSKGLLVAGAVAIPTIFFLL